jgi:hypothetical protein
MTRLTHSSLQTLMTCSYKYYLAYVMNLRPDREADYFRLGTMYHLCHEMTGNGASMADVMEAIRQNYEYPPAYIDDDDKRRKWYYEAATVACLFAGYQEHYKDSPIVVLKTEYVFNIPIVNPETGHAARTHTFAGKVDKQIQWAYEIGIQEYKTTSEDITPSSDYWKRLAIDTQVTGYLVGSQDGKVVIYDVTRKPTIRPELVDILDEDGVRIVTDRDGERVMTANGKKWRETGDKEKGYTLQTRHMTTEEWAAKLSADIRLRPEFYYARREIPRTQDDIDRFTQELWDKHIIANEFKKNNRYFRNTSACLGRSKCVYFNICTQGIDVTQGVPNGYVRVSDPHVELVEA